MLLWRNGLRRCLKSIPYQGLGSNPSRSTNIIMARCWNSVDKFDLKSNVQ